MSGRRFFPVAFYCAVDAADPWISVRRRTSKMTAVDLPRLPCQDFPAKTSLPRLLQLYARQPASRQRRRGRVMIDEVLPLQLGPELRRNRRLHGAHIGEDLRLGMRADD